MDEGGNKVIDAAELIRVYGDACQFDQEEKRGSAATVHALSDQTDQQDLKRLQDLLEKEQQERERERKQYREQVEQLQESLKLAQEGQNRATLLLENHRKSSDEWEKTLLAVQKQISNQDQSLRKEFDQFKETAGKKLAQYKRALEEERSKSVWSRLWRTT